MSDTRHRFEDVDADGIEISVQDGWLFVSYMGDDGCVEASRALTQVAARAIAPLLQHFADTGTLPEPKS